MYHGRWKPWPRRPGKRVEILKPMSKHIPERNSGGPANIQVNANSLKDQVVAIQRVTKVVKGGRTSVLRPCCCRRSAGTPVRQGKAREVPMAIRKASSRPEDLIHLNLKGTTIPHQVLGLYGSGQVLLKPAPDVRELLRRPSARRDGSRGNFQRVDEVHRHVQPHNVI